MVYNYDNYEDKAFEQFEELAKRKQGWFSTYTRTEPMTVYDVNCTSVSGIKEALELKYRGYNALSYEDCFIENKKLCNIKDVCKKKGMRPVYINFFGSWKNAYIWFLDKVTKGNAHLNVVIPINPDTKETKVEDRIGLRWQDGYHFVWDDNNNKWNITEPTYD